MHMCCQRLSICHVPAHLQLGSLWIIVRLLAGPSDGAACFLAPAEHLAAVEIMQLKHIIILQNKIDLIDETKATTQHDQIQSFIQVRVPPPCSTVWVQPVDIYVALGASCAAARL